MYRVQHWYVFNLYRYLQRIVCRFIITFKAKIKRILPFY